MRGLNPSRDKWEWSAQLKKCWCGKDVLHINISNKNEESKLKNWNDNLGLNGDYPS